MKFILPLTILLLFSNNICLASRDDDIFLGYRSVKYFDKLNVVKQWRSIEKNLRNATNSFTQFILSDILRNMEIEGVSTLCKTDLLHFSNGLNDLRDWAFSVFDASGKSLDGILSGTLSAHGCFQECVETVARSKPSDDEVIFTGRYCSIDIKANPISSLFTELPEELKDSTRSEIDESPEISKIIPSLPFRLGLCVPSGCTKDDISAITQMVMASFPVQTKVLRCETKDEPNPSLFQHLMYVWFCILVFIVLAGTLIDLRSRYTETDCKSKTIQVLMQFSFIKNVADLTNTHLSDDILRCLNGMRFFSMAWIILGHTYILPLVNYRILNNMEVLMSYIEGIGFQAIANFTVCVETFFFIGGLLYSYLPLKRWMVEGETFSVKYHLLHRLWRILPLYIHFIMFMPIVKLLGSGPVWHDIAVDYVDGCYGKWWQNFLFLDNYFNTEHVCHTWYIASDFQLYLACLPILLTLLRWPRIGIFVNLLVIATSMIYSGDMTYKYKLPPTLLFANFDSEKMQNYMAHFYVKPIAHAGSYCIGILAGYILATKPTLKIPAKFQVVGWSLTFLFMSSVLYGTLTWNRGVAPSIWCSVLYASFHRIAWTLGVAWMIVCCCTGHGGVINYILSLEAFALLGRLIFATGLTFFIVQAVVLGNMPVAIDPHHNFLIWMFSGNLCMACIVACAVKLTIEAPFSSLEKIFYPRENKINTKLSHSKEAFKGIHED